MERQEITKVQGLTATRLSRTVVLATCDGCKAHYKCYIPNPEHAAWEIEAWFDRHVCSTLRGDVLRYQRENIPRLHAGAEKSLMNAARATPFASDAT
jgi:hypothetical protein